MLDPLALVEIEDMRNRGLPNALLQPDQHAAFVVSFTQSSDSDGNARQPERFLWALAVQRTANESGRVGEELDGCWMTESVAPIGQWVVDSTRRAR